MVLKQWHSNQGFPICAKGTGRRTKPSLECYISAAAQMLATAEWDLLLDFIDPASKDRIDLCDRDSPGFKAW